MPSAKKRLSPTGWNFSVTWEHYSTISPNFRHLHHLIFIFYSLNLITQRMAYLVFLVDLFFMLSAEVEHERQLIQRLYARDEQAMALFYKQYHRALYQVIWRLVRQHELSEDILQESMLKFWFSFASYDASRGRLFTWALNISRNLAIDCLRERRYREVQLTDSLSMESDRLVASTTFRPEHIGVRDWLNVLPASDRELMEVLYLQGYTQVEASEHLQLPLGTVKSRVKRIVKTLAQVIS
jgi:RNA polymerase sigma factor (sigma-70 family)